MLSIGAESISSNSSIPAVSPLLEELEVEDDELEEDEDVVEVEVLLEVLPEEVVLTGGGIVQFPFTHC